MLRWYVAEILQECCGNSAGMLRKFCRNEDVAGILQVCCRNMLQKFGMCRYPAGMLQNSRNIFIPQVCCRNSACVLMDAADMLQTFWRNPAEIQSGVCRRKKLGV